MPGVVAYTDGPAAMGTSEDESRHAADTTLSVVSGFGAVQKLQSSGAPVMVPPGDATSAVSVSVEPGGASAGSLLTASTRVDVTSASFGPRSGLHAATRTIAKSARPS